MYSNNSLLQISPTKSCPLLPFEEDEVPEEDDHLVHFCIEIVGAKGLRSVGVLKTSNRCNAICECSLVLSGGRGRQSNKDWKTQVAQRSSNPVWCHTLDFGRVEISTIASIQIDIKHISRFGLRNSNIGHVSIDVQSLLYRKEVSGYGAWFPLDSHENQGQIHIKSLIRPCTPRFVRESEQLFAASDIGITSPRRRLRVSSSSYTAGDHCSHNKTKELETIQEMNQEVPKHGEIWYALERNWLNDWLMFVSSKDLYPPGPIPNMFLVQDELTPDGSLQLRTDLSLKTDYRLINEDTWEFYCLWYGGGPSVFIEIPADCPDVLQWLHAVNLSDIATIDATNLTRSSHFY